MSVKAYAGERFEFTAPVLIAGAGACGLTAALAARDAGADVLVLERDAVPLGTTSMSSGLIPAAATKAQRAAGVEDDSCERFAADLIKKTGGDLDPERAVYLTVQSTQKVDWLIDQHDIPLSLFVAGGALPGHSRARLHGTPNRTGEELIAALQAAAAGAGVDIMTNALVSALLVEDGRAVRGVEVTRPDGAVELIGCDTLILAACGFAGNAELVAKHIPDITNAIVHTHPGSQGEAIRWGEALGAALGDIHSYQGHANIAAGQGLLVSWLAMSEGGFQLNASGQRFNNEARGYSEHAVDVASQAGGFAWSIFDQRIHDIMMEIAEYRDVSKTDALRYADTLDALAQNIKVPVGALKAEMWAIENASQDGQPDRFGRMFAADKALAAPYIAVKVNGALFHTQGGLEIDKHARVLDQQSRAFPNLFAGGGSARGVSGPGASGYVAGKGLMTATTYGRLAGTAAAQQVMAQTIREEVTA